MNTTISKENYLKTVYAQTSRGELTVTTSKIAKKLSITNAATSEMARKLADESLLSYTKYKGVNLTEVGKEIALKVIRRHRLWETFLENVLNMSWSEVHCEAENLEHSSSDLLMDKIDEFLGFPKFDPHGSPIPGKNGEMPEVPDYLPLKEVATGSKYVVTKVSDKNSELIEYFTEIGLLLNKKITLIKRFSFDNSVQIKIDNSFHTLSEKISENIFVSELK